MHYAPQPGNALGHLSYLPEFDAPGLGQWGELAKFAIGGAKQAYDNSQDDTTANTDQSAGMPGSRSSNKSVPRQPSALSTISTAVVTQVSPQISPVMTQQQSSPGATVGANPTQFMPGGLSADQAISPYGGYAAPGMPGASPGISPFQPYTRDPRSGGYTAIDPRTGQPINAGYLDSSGGQYSPVSVGGASMTDIPWIPIAIVGGGVALALFLRKRKK